MRRGPFFVLLVVCLFIVIAAVLVSLRQDRQHRKISGQQQVKVLFDDLAIGRIERLQVMDQQDRTELQKEDGRWVVVSKYGYPADSGSLNGLLQALDGMRVVERVNAVESDYERLELLPPDEARVGESQEGAGTLVAAWLPDQPEPVLELILGTMKEQEREMGGGMTFPVARYVRIPGDAPRVLLTEETFTGASGRAKDWLDPEFVRMNGVMKRVELLKGSDLLWALVRERNDREAELRAVPPTGADQQLNKQKVNRIGEATTFLRYKDIAPPSKTRADYDFGEAHTLVAKSFNGEVWTLTFAPKLPEGYYPTTVAVDFEAPAEPEQGAEEERVAQYEAQVEETRARVERLNSKFDGWIYLVSPTEVQLETILVPREALLTAVEAEAGAEDAAPQDGDGGEDPLEGAGLEPDDMPAPEDMEVEEVAPETAPEGLDDEPAGLEDGPRGEPEQDGGDAPKAQPDATIEGLAE